MKKNIGEEFKKAVIKEEFKIAVKPLHEFLCNYGHPHSTVIVTLDNAEYLEGSIATPLKVPD